MKVTFIVADMWGMRLDTIHSGHCLPPQKRTVSIELTNEQENQLNIQQVGTDGSRPVYEEIAECFVESECQGV